MFYKDGIAVTFLELKKKVSSLASPEITVEHIDSVYDSLIDGAICQSQSCLDRFQVRNSQGQSVCVQARDTRV